MPDCLQFATKIILIFSCLTLLENCQKKSETPLDIATELNQTYKSHTSLTYDIDYQIKRFNEKEDTFKIKASVDLIRVSEDTILGGYVWIMEDSIEKYYDTKHTFLIMHQKKSITQFTPTPIDPFPFRGDYREILNTYFLRPEKLINGATSETVSVTIEDTSLYGENVWKWTYNFPVDKSHKKIQKNIWIRQDNYEIPEMNFLSIDYQNENQYNQWDLNNKAYDQVAIANLKDRFTKLKANYSFEPYVPPSDNITPFLTKGDNAPKLTINSYLEGHEGFFEDYDDKITLIDFWYMDCPPCVQAIPHLNELHQKYSEKGLQVLGVNPIDNSEKNLKRFPNFLAHNHIDYPIILTNKREIEPFNVVVYPTFYLIDKTGKILQMGMGFDKKAMKQLDGLIQTVL